MTAEISRLPGAAPAPERVAQLVVRLQAEAREAGRDHIALVLAQLDEIEQILVEVAAGGEAYPPGVRADAAHLADLIAARRGNMASIMERM